MDGTTEGPDGRSGWIGTRRAGVALALACAALAFGLAVRAVGFAPTGYALRTYPGASGGPRHGDGRCAVLLHGLARTARSMRPLAEAIAARGTPAVAVDYPSRAFPIATLAPEAVDRGVAACIDAGATRIDVVTHSMGGILVRRALADAPLPALGRVVMLAPPNAGSEVVDALRDVPGFAAFNGPAGLELGTGPDAVPARLGPTGVDLGIVAGRRSINPLLSLLLPNPDDGKVSAARTRLAGMCGWLLVPASHPLIMRRRLVLDETVAWLETGRFASAAAEHPPCPARRTGGDGGERLTPK